MAKLSVIMAIYNTEAYLPQSLDSIVHQSHRDLEIILVDDGSTDRSGKICDEYAKQDQRIQVIHQKNAGMPFALNCGLDHATGEWVTFCDSDDWLEENCYESIFQLVKNEKADVIFEQGCFEELPNGTQKKKINFDDSFEVTEGPGMEQVLARTQSCLDQDPKKYRLWGYYWDKLFRRDLLESNGLRFATSAASKLAIADSLFVFQALCAAKCVSAVSFTGYHYRVRENSLTTNRAYNGNLPDAYLDFYHRLSSCANTWGKSKMIMQTIYARSFDAVAKCLQRTYFNPNNPDNKKTVAGKIKMLKSDPFMKEAIACKSNEYFTYQHIALKYLLRLPHLWPLELCWKTYFKIKNI